MFHCVLLSANWQMNSWCWECLALTGSLHKTVPGVMSCCSALRRQLSFSMFQHVCHHQSGISLYFLLRPRRHLCKSTSAVPASLHTVHVELCPIPYDWTANPLVPPTCSKAVAQADVQAGSNIPSFPSQFRFGVRVCGAGEGGRAKRGRCTEPLGT